MEDENSKHKMVTRSKRKKETSDSTEEKKPKIIDSDNELDEDILNTNPSSPSSFESDVDEHGNIKGLIDYDYKDEINILEIPEIYSEEDENYSEEEEFIEEDFLEEEDIDDEEMLIGKLLSRYINDKMDNEQIVLEENNGEDDETKYDEILIRLQKYIE